MYYLKYFFLTSILGFFLETIICKGYESGILYGPITPVYGIGTLIIIFLADKILKKRNLKPLFKFIILTISCMTLLSLAELVGGLLIEKIFHQTFWDYTNYKYNIGKYICLEMSLLWASASLAFVFILRPTLDIIIKKIPNILVYISSVIFVIDIICTLINK